MSEKKFNTEKVFATKSALSFEEDISKSTSKNESRVSVHGAPGTGPLSYDWTKKVVVQLSDAECMSVIAVFLGCAKSFEAKSHGPQKDKQFSIEVQSKGVFYIKVGQLNNGMFAVPVSREGAFKIPPVFLKQVQENRPWMSCGEIMQMVKDVSSCLAAASASQ